MKQMIKILQKYSLLIVLILFLIVIQVYCELSLPAYVSKLFNVGIQQKGIEIAVPRVIKEDTYKKVLLFLNKEERELLNSNYKLITKENKQKYNYKYLDNNNLYILKDNIQNISDMENEYILGITMVNKLINADSSELLKYNITTNEDVFVYLENIDQDGLIIFQEQMNSIYDKSNDKFLKQKVIKSIQEEYDHIGIDLKENQFNYLKQISFKMIFLVIIIITLMIIISFLVSNLATQFGRDLRNKVIKKIMLFSNEEIEDFTSTTLINRVVNDIPQIVFLIVSFFKVIMYTLVVSLIMLLKVIESPLKWVICLIIIIFSSLNLILFYKNKFIKKNILNHSWLKKELFINSQNNFINVLLFLVINGVFILTIWIGAKNVNFGNIQIGTLIAFVIYEIQILFSFSILTMIFDKVFKSFISIKYINEILKKEISIKQVKFSKRFNNTKKGLLEFKNVCFTSKNSYEIKLENINLCIDSGSTNVITGMSIKEQNLFLNLIIRLSEPTSGKIIFEGIDIKESNLKDLRERVSFSPYNGVLFSGTIKSNICFTNKRINKEEIQKAIVTSKLATLMAEKKFNYNYEISHYDKTISNHDKQSLYMARSIIANPDILIFDDSFGTLDYQIIDNLKNEYSIDKTIIIFAKKVNKNFSADKLITFKNGKIKESTKYKTGKIDKIIASPKEEKEGLIHE